MDNKWKFIMCACDEDIVYIIYAKCFCLSASAV